ncbi:MAG: HAD-IIIA family hydrolase [Gammaproteobacteria bacterium]|nr:HAD-IIIA family hydrolase [Gammaproteobacteria bacterium]
MTIKTIILDRDGVINYDSDLFIKSPDEFIFLPNSIQALENIAKYNIQLFITTNQSGLARNLFDRETFFLINQKLLTNLSTNLSKNIITAIYYCPHYNNNCPCRKPLPGMINKIKLIHNINLETTALIGDSMRDLEAGKAAGCQYNFLVKTGKGQEVYNKSSNSHLFNNTNCFSELNSCINYIIDNYI